MKKDLGYPIKYAVLQLKVPGGWIDNYDDVTIGFIVSKCYVIEKKVRYFGNGASQESYKVVFPFKNFREFQCSLLDGKQYYEEASIPIYNSYNGTYQNGEVVSSVFDTFEDALEVAEDENRKKRRLMLSGIQVSNYNSVVEEFEKNLYLCKTYEEFILENTAEMLISNDILDVKVRQRQRQREKI